MASTTPGKWWGESSLSGNAGAHAFRTGPNQPINPATDDLGTLGGTWSTALGINVWGEVVGESSISGDTAYHAFRSTGTFAPMHPSLVDLGTLGGTNSQAYAINGSGQVVGSSQLKGDATQHAFLYGYTVMHDLNSLIPADSGWELLDAYAINDAGEIVGDGMHNGSRRAFLLAPIPISTKTTIKSSNQFFSPGDVVTFTTVVKPSPAVLVATGTVTFIDSGYSQTILAEVPLANGKASFTTTLPNITQYVKAVYSGDRYCKGSESRYITEWNMP